MSKRYRLCSNIVSMTARSSLLSVIFGMFLIFLLSSCTVNRQYLSRLSKAESLELSGNEIAATNEYRKAVRIDPSRPEARLKLAAMYLNQNRLDESLNELNLAGEALDRSYLKYSAEQMTSLKAARYYLLATLFAKRNQTAEESMYRDLCLSIDPKNKSCQTYVNVSAKQQEVPKTVPQNQNRPRPKITIDIDKESLPEKTSLSFIIVSGAIKSTNPINKITVAGVEAVLLDETPSGETFAKEVPLRPGQNIIPVNVTDSEDNKNAIDVRIQRIIDFPNRGALLILGNSLMNKGAIGKQVPFSISGALISSIPPTNIDLITGIDVTTERIQSSITEFMGKSLLNELIIYIDLPVRVVREGERRTAYWLTAASTKSDVSGTGLSLSKLLPPSLMRNSGKFVLLIANTDKTESLLTDVENHAYVEAGWFFLCGARATKLDSAPLLFDSQLFDQSIAGMFEQKPLPENMFGLLDEASNRLSRNSYGAYELVFRGYSRVAERISLKRNSQNEVLKREGYLAIVSEFLNARKLSQVAVAGISTVLVRDDTAPSISSQIYKLIDYALASNIQADSFDREFLRWKSTLK